MVSAAVAADYDCDDDPFAAAPNYDYAYYFMYPLSLYRHDYFF